MLWKIFYGDGSTYSSDHGSAKDAPALNLQAIMFADEKVGRMILRGGDFYLYLDDVWLSVDIFGMLDQMIDVFRLVQRDEGRWWFRKTKDDEWKLTDHLTVFLQIIGTGLVKAGRNIPREQFEEIVARALHDPDFPRKSAKLPYGPPYEASKSVEPRAV